MNKQIGTPSQTKQILQRHTLTLKKSLGQNFLVDPNILHSIVDLAELDREVGVIEVGPGIGALTEQLAMQAGKVVSFEIDQRLIPILQEGLASYSNVQIIHQDILKADIRSYVQQELEQYPRLSVVANLPYYITTPIMMNFLDCGVRFEHMVFMIQKEVADRIAAVPGTKDYGSLSLAVQYYAEASVEKLIPRSVFIPPPHVDSALLKLKMRDHPPVQVDNEAFFFQIIRACFAQRRKTLLNNLVTYFGAKDQREELIQALQQLDIDPARRGETLTMSEFARLSNHLLQWKQD